MTKFIFEYKKYLFRNIVLILFCILSSNTQAQIMTQPLFMQMKTPRLESSSGTLIDSNHNIYHINSIYQDSVDISFLISVPKEMLSEKWAISLTPSIYSSTENGRLREVVVKGWKFAEVQNESYDRYDKFMNSIVDSSMYEKAYIDHQRLRKEIEHWHDVYWQFYYDEWERQVKYEIWKGKQDGSIRSYLAKDKLSYEEQLLNQYLLRIRNQSNRYLEAGMDTTGLYSKYMNEFKIHKAKMPRYFVNQNIVANKVPKKYKDIHVSGRTLQDITDSMLELLVKRDSALLALPVLDYSKIVENEKRSMLKNGIYEDIIQLPRNENALLDTIIYDMRTDYSYLYSYRYPIHPNGQDTVIVKLQSKILATDGSGFSTTSEDVITYTFSSFYDYESKDEIVVPTINQNDKLHENANLKTEKFRDEQLLKELSKNLRRIESDNKNNMNLPDQRTLNTSGGKLKKGKYN